MGEHESMPDAGGPGEPGTEEEPVLRSTRLPPATAALRSSLEDQQARAHELRAALDELRTTLEGGAPGARPSSGGAPRGTDRSRRPPLVLALLGAGALVVAIAAALAVNGRSSRPATGAVPSASGPVPATATASEPPATSAQPSPSPSIGASTSASASRSGPATPSPSRSQIALPLTTHPMAWPGGPVLDPPGLARSGPGADAPGLELTAAVDPDERHLDVYERIVLRPGVTSLHLAPARLGSLPRVLRGARPTVTDLQVELDGRAVRPVAGRTGWQVGAPSGSTIGRAVLRYRVLGAFVRQTPAPPGRVTLILQPLGDGPVAATDDPAVVRLSDQRVGTVTCPTARRPLCAVSSGRTHTATIARDGSAIVLAQLNLS